MHLKWAKSEARKNSRERNRKKVETERAPNYKWKKGIMKKICRHSFILLLLGFNLVQFECLALSSLRFDLLQYFALLHSQHTSDSVVVKQIDQLSKHCHRINQINENSVQHRSYNAIAKIITGNPYIHYRNIYKKSSIYPRQPFWHF